MIPFPLHTFLFRVSLVHIGFSVACRRAQPWLSPLLGSTWPVPHSSPILPLVTAHPTQIYDLVTFFSLLSRCFPPYLMIPTHQSFLPHTITDMHTSYLTRLLYRCRVHGFTVHWLRHIFIAENVEIPHPVTGLF